ncbi:IroD [Klebsiella pneumoniae subsp. rhinoscleromatis]|nr:IroD [Klebsiella pneumoniae subsp. rhinoscleromatis]
MLNMQQHPSAIARLRSQLAAGHIANVSDFWRDAESLNGPLVMPVEGAEDEREVTLSVACLALSAGRISASESGNG